MNELKTYLALTDQQLQQLQQLIRSRAEAIRPLHEQIRQKQQTLDQQLASGSASATALGQLLLDIQNLRKQVESTHATFHTQALNVLNEAQRGKLNGLQEAARLQPAIQQGVTLSLLDPPVNRTPMGPGIGLRALWRGFGLQQPIDIGSAEIR